MEHPTNPAVPAHRYRGARAMVSLHEAHLRDFVKTWRRAKAANVALPSTADPDYASLEALLYHLCRAARGYLVWICAQLELPDPGVEAPPPPSAIEAGLDAWLDHLFEPWRTALVKVPATRFEDRDYPSRWKRLYSIDAMLEHAVMHPIRHRFQLEELIVADTR